MGEDAYKIRPGGSLKFKDGSSEKKKKKSSTSSKVRDVKATSSGEAASSSSSAHAGGSTQLERTEAERRFDEIQKKRLVDKVKTEAKQSHKEKVDKFNTYLESLSEHYDIPKVGPG
ncbi:hypothetical protein V8E36_004606 [Tilletia maclaganii]